MSGSLKEIAKGRSDIFRIDPKELQVKPEWNTRNFNDADNRAHIDSLKMSIKEIGVVDPMIVFKEDSKIYLSDGHCRHQAVLELLSEGVEIVSVPVMTEGRAASEADYLLRQALDGKPKTAIELRHIFKRLLAYGWSEEQIASRSGKGTQSVRQALDFAAAPAAVQKLVDSGRVSATLAQAVYAKEGPKAAATLGNAVDAAAQRGKQRATAQDIGTAPSEPRKARLTQVAEMIEKWQWDETEDSWCTVTITDGDRALLFKLLDI